MARISTVPNISRNSPESNTVEVMGFLPVNTPIQPSLREDFGRIEQASRVERMLDRVHQGKFDLRFVLPHFCDEILADAVLGAEGAPKLRGYAISQPVHFIDYRLLVGKCVPGIETEQRDKVQVPISEMADDQDADTRKSLFENRADAADEFRYFRHRHGGVGGNSPAR